MWGRRPTSAMPKTEVFVPQQPAAVPFGGGWLRFRGVSMITLGVCLSGGLDLMSASSPSLLPPLPPPLLLRPMFAARKNVRRDCSRMLPASSTLCKQLQEQRLKCVQVLSISHTDCRKSSDILYGVSSDILSDNLCISPHVLSSILSGIFSDILGISIDILSDVLSDILLAVFL